MKIGVVMVAYGLAEAITRLFESAETYSYEVEYHLFLHSQKPDVVAACEAIAASVTLNPIARPYVVCYYPYGVNRGLSKSWNEGMLNAFANGCQTVIIVNDDVEFGVGDLAALADTALLQPHLYLVTAKGWSIRHQETVDMGYSCFAINPLALQTIGCFDENIFPIYFEDCDYHRRAHLLDMERGYCAVTNVQHGGSMTIHSDATLMEQQNITYARNADYYLRKWGDNPGAEVYPTPFDDPELGLDIPPDARHQPYGVKYDRTDFDEIVKV